MNLSLSEIILFGCLCALTTASPITFMLSDQYGRHFMIPYHSPYRQVERSDHVSLTHGDEYENSGGGGGDYSGHGQNGFEPSTGHYGTDNSQEYTTTYNNYDHNSHGSYEQNSHRGGYDYGIPENGGDIHGENHIHSTPVSEHVEITKPVAVPVYKEIGIPVSQPVNIHIPHPVAIGVAQPYPVAVPVSRPVPIHIIKTIAVPVEKKVPYAVEKHIPVPIEKPVPIHVERHIPVPVEKPYPIKIPVYKTIHHHAKSSHGH